MIFRILFRNPLRNMTHAQTRKITRVGKRSRCVVIPAHMLEELGWQDRQEVSVTYSPRSKRIVIREKDCVVSS